MSRPNLLPRTLSKLSINRFPPSDYAGLSGVSLELKDNEFGLPFAAIASARSEVGNRVVAKVTQLLVHNSFLFAEPRTQIEAIPFS